jgi:hypothetical protein
MISHRKTIVFAAFLSIGLAQGVAQPAAAAGVLYECDITDRQKKVDWVSPKLAVILPEQGQAQVYDSIILNFVGKPVPAKVRKRGDNLIVSWSLKGLRDSNEQTVPTFEYTAKLNTKTNAVHLTANPTSYPNRWTGRGTCKQRTK